MACGRKLTKLDYPRRKTFIYGVEVSVPVVCWDGKACLRRVAKKFDRWFLAECGIV
jgi:hypothetical protein